MPLFPDVIKKNVIIKKNIQLKELNTFKIGGICKNYLEPCNIEGLIDTINFLNENSYEYNILGGGSNLLINDKEFDFIVSLKRFNEITKKDEDDRSVTTIIDAGVSLKRVISWQCNQGYSGFEELTAIPASIGGAIKMNAGTKDFSISNILNKVLILHKNKLIWLNKNEITFDYRYSSFNDDDIIIKCEFKLKKEDKELIKERIYKNIKKRLQTQPISKPSAGCIFKNPHNISAGKLIDMCGLKGKNKGDAIVSNKHANFIINNGNAKFNDVIYLIEYIKDVVYKKTNYLLKNEVIIWN